MTVIQTVDAQRFTLNGIKYFKNFLSYVAGDKLSIYNAYDFRDVRVPLTNFAEIQVDGTVYANVADLQTALLPVIYTRDTLGDLITASPYYNKFIIVNGFDLIDNDLTVAANWEWLINGTELTNPAAVVINVPFADAGKKRIDIIVANSNNTFVRLVGTEVGTAAVAAAPEVPAGVLAATFLNVTEDTISQPVIIERGEYLGTYPSREAMLDEVATGLVVGSNTFGSFGHIKNTNVLELFIFDGTDFVYYDLIQREFRRPIKIKASTPYPFEAEDFEKLVVLLSGASQTVELDSDVDYPDNAVLMVRNMNNATCYITAPAPPAGILFTVFGLSFGSIKIPAGYTAIIRKFDNASNAYWMINFETVPMIDGDFADDMDSARAGLAVDGQYNSGGFVKIRLT